MHYVAVSRKLCRFAVHGLSMTLADYTLVFAKNMEKSVKLQMNDSSFNPEHNTINRSLTH